MAQSNVLAGFIELVEKRYRLQVVDAQYVKVDDLNDRYHMILEVILPNEMAEKFGEKYGTMDAAMRVRWSSFQGRIRFRAEIGNNILLLLDSLK
jgi:hypothetical protein